MKVWQDAQREMSRKAYERILPELRTDVPPDLSISILYARIANAADPVRCDRLGLSRQEAVLHAVDLWSRGALRRPNLQLVESEPED